MTAVDSKELARLVAADFGPDVDAALAIASGAVPSRGIAMPDVSLSDAIAIASFIIACAQIALQAWQKRPDRIIVTLKLAETIHDNDGTPLSSTDLERKLCIMGRTVDKLAPEFGPTLSLPTDKQSSKKDWVADWINYDPRASARSMTAAILLPFRDMDYFAITKPIHWTPPIDAPAELPRSVSVPVGFVTDLASIPTFFCWMVQPVGRHGHAAILHDWLYWEQNCDRAVADKVFEVAMAELDVAVPVRKALWAAVRVFGRQYWDQAREQKRQGRSRLLAKLPNEPVSWAVWQSTPGVFAPP
ncbi:DUF1353 domain-containing protein [Bradyrhizobium sp. 200]|uniref:DUF1353 domain-containing protein n=1 Tax=Bradyrhizobium sp. 200 TaxID=2782665 RepID=UPI001FFE4BD0|nr:DUF1353 domain-containing protein [Bradyrhizobium sp. 200]UPJ53386.1 DUF1353 domain-containing protein [Bradyrhizobium sp. 200]